MKVHEIDVFGIGVNILVCITECLTEDLLRANWRDIRNKLASERQLCTMDDFERWNFYLFYVVEDKKNINRSLKYEIEHDTVSSRKIIVNQTECAQDDFLALVSSYIKFDIGQVHPQKQIPVFKRDDSVVKILNDEN